ncbi:MAG: hypothetical protein R8M14_00275 [Ghiorsea sp.]
MKITALCMVLAISGCGGSTEPVTNPSVTTDVKLPQLSARSEAKLEISYLVGGKGSPRPDFSLYTYNLDYDGVSSQFNQCSEYNWLSLLVEDGLLSDAYTGLIKLGRITRHDATEQVTYDGKPLYFISVIQSLRIKRAMALVAFGTSPKFMQHYIIS